MQYSVFKYAVQVIMNIDNYFRGRNWHTAVPWAKLCSFGTAQGIKNGFYIFKESKDFIIDKSI